MVIEPLDPHLGVGQGGPGRRPAMLDSQLPSFPFDALPPIARRYVGAVAAIMSADPSAIAMMSLATAGGAVPPGVSLQIGDTVVEPPVWVLVVGQEAVDDLLLIIEQCTGLLDSVGLALDPDFNQAWISLCDWDGKGECPKSARVLHLGDAGGEALITRFLQRGEGGLVVRYELVDWLRASLRAEPAIPAVRMFGALDQQANAAALLGLLEPPELAEFRALTALGVGARFLPVMVRSMEDLAGALPPEITRLRSKWDEGDLGGEAWNEYVAATVECDTLFRELAQLPARELELDPAASEIINEFQARARCLAEVEGAGGFGAFLVALPVAVGSLTLVLHLLTYGREALNLTVDAVAAEAAVRILETFVIPHAQAVYGD
jgi:hypothetical protein